MSDLSKAFKKSLEGGADRYKKEGDIEKDGILYCGVCKEPKQSWFDCGDGDKVLIPIRCKCVRAEEEKERLKDEYDKKMQLVSKLRAHSLMDAMFYQSTFKNYIHRTDNEKQYKICLKYFSNFGQMHKESQGLLFYGPVGTGKSYAAACIANALLDSCVSVVMTSLILILKHLSSDIDDQEATIDELMEPDLLILDDLGAERSTDYALEKVYDIIDSRYRSRKPIILTTNLTIQEMKNNTDIRYARIYDRVFEMCYPVKFDGVSRRKIEAKKRFERMAKFFEGDEN